MALCLAAPAGAIEFVVNREDGEVFIKNPAAVPVTFDGYTLFSPGEALIVEGWIPVTGNYDLGGDQSVDSDSNWFIISPATETNVAEASLTTGSGSLEAGQVVSLGLFFNTSLLEGLVATVSANSEVTDPFVADFRTLTADYDGDLDVDLDDHGVFVSTFGSTSDLRADGNGDGIINAIDFTVWRDSEELVFEPNAISAIALATLPTAGGAAIPEPASALLTLGLLATGISSRRRR